MCQFPEWGHSRALGGGVVGRRSGDNRPRPPAVVGGGGRDDEEATRAAAALAAGCCSRTARWATSPSPACAGPRPNRKTPAPLPGTPSSPTGDWTPCRPYRLRSSCHRSYLPCLQVSPVLSIWLDKWRVETRYLSW